MKVYEFLDRAIEDKVVHLGDKTQEKDKLIYTIIYDGNSKIAKIIDKLIYSKIVDLEGIGVGTYNESSYTQDIIVTISFDKNQDYRKN